MNIEDLGTMQYVLNPRSIAVIGASSDNEKEKNSGWVGRLLQFGYKGKIYPINLKAKEILGLEVFSSIEEVSESIDYAIIAVPRNLVLSSLKQCIAKGVKAVHIYTAGFRETGSDEGLKLQRNIEEVIRNSQTRVIGPNCMGVYSPAAGLTFDVRFPKQKGSIAFISQTGVGGRRLINLASGRGLRFQMAVSYGNSIDLGANDFLEHALSDSEIDLVFIYLEGLTNGQRLFANLRMNSMKKPVVILKAGLSQSGAGAVASHTASLGGSKQVWDAFFKQTGAVPVESLEEAVEVMVGFQRLPPIYGRRIGLVGRGGGIGVIATDMCEREGLKVPELETETKIQLAKVTPAEAGSIVRNPVEIGLGITGLSENYVKGLQIVASDPKVDCIITFLNPEDYIHYNIQGWVEDIGIALGEAKKNLSKPFAVVLLPGTGIEVFTSIQRIQRHCQKEGIACFTGIETAIKAVSKLISYYQFANN